MPFSPTRIFLEETSLVARPAIAFPELKARLEARMAHLGIRVKSIEEEEYCLIPMGGRATAPAAARPGHRRHSWHGPSLNRYASSLQNIACD